MNVKERFLSLRDPNRSRYRRIGRGNKMTLIIGAKCKDGVVLVSDRMIFDTATNKTTWEKKLYTPYENSPITFGAAGYAHVFKQFNRKIIVQVDERIRDFRLRNIARLKELGLTYTPGETAEESERSKIQSKDISGNPQQPQKNDTEELIPYVYTGEHFIGDCQSLIRDLCSRDGNSENLLDVLLILHDKIPRLHHISANGEEEDVSYYAIGSGSPFVDIFLRNLWSPEKSIEDTLKLAYFCILFVQGIKFDGFVGVEDGKLPDNAVILNDGRTGSFEFNNPSQLLKEIKEEVEKFNNMIFSLKL